MVAAGVILAAGRGTRLGEHTEDVPKPMVEVGGRPLVDHIVASMVAAGARRLTVVTGYLADLIESHLAANSPIPVAFVRQEVPNGTAAALQCVAGSVGYEPFLLAWGDIATDPRHFQTAVEAWDPQLAGVVGVNEMEDVSGGSSVVFDEDYSITGIIEKPQGDPPSRWNSAGVMVFGPQIWGHLETLRPSPRGELELPDAMTSLLAAGERLRAVPLTGSWYDVGTPESLQAARASFGK